MIVANLQMESVAMRKQNRKTLSILMIGVLLFLSFSAELAHINCLVETDATQHLVTHRPEESSQANGSFTTICTACAFHTAQMATPQISLSTIRFAPAGVISEAVTPYQFQNHTSHYSLRAPPFSA